MILGFLGKGGSGKTTLATLMTKHLLLDGMKVLAIDNDHNMDFAFNLGHEGEMEYVGQAIQEAYDAVGISYTLDLLDKEGGSVFSISPPDAFTEKYSQKLGDGCRLMVAGPHTEKIMKGAQCSHALTMPLKVYLPLLGVHEGEYVIVDEKAGVDGVGTGVTSGFNAAIIVAEATVHGIKAAVQIARMLEFYKTPYSFVLNKVRQNTDIKELTSMLPGDVLATFNADESMMDLVLSEDAGKGLDAIRKWSGSLADSRRERSTARLQMLKEEVSLTDK